MKIKIENKIDLLMVVVVALVVSIMAAQAYVPIYMENSSTGYGSYDTDAYLRGTRSGSSGSGSGSSSGSSGSGSSDTSLRTPGGCLKSLVPAGTEEVLKDSGTHAIRYFSNNEVIADLIGRSGGTEIYMKTGGTGAADYNYIVGKICYSGRDKVVGYIYPDQVKTAREKIKGTSSSSADTWEYCKNVPPEGRQVSVDKSSYGVSYYETQEAVPDVTAISGASYLYMRNPYSGAGDYNYIVGTICGTIQDNKFSFIYPAQLEKFRAMINAKKTDASDPRNLSDDTVITIPEDKTEIYVDTDGNVYDAKTKEKYSTAHYDVATHVIHYVDNGQITNSSFGKMLTKTRGYINLKTTYTPNYGDAYTEVKEVPKVTEEPSKTEDKPVQAEPVKMEDEKPETPVKLEAPTVATPPADYEKEEVVTTPSVNPFNDTDTTTLVGTAAATLYEAAVIGGYPDGTFKGERPVNRAEAAKFLLLASQTTVEEGAMNNGRFWDVVDGQWYTKFVMTAARKGVINGHPDGSFKPADTVNTAEFLKMMTKAFQLPENKSHKYVDVKEGDWFGAYAGLAAEYNLFPERNQYRLLPTQKLTRGEVAVAIYQILKAQNPAGITPPAF